MPRDPERKNKQNAEASNVVAPKDVLVEDRKTKSKSLCSWRHGSWVWQSYGFFLLSIYFSFFLVLMIIVNI